MLQDHATCGDGGLAQAPCVRCLTFERPVNPHEYEYYGTRRLIRTGDSKKLRKGNMLNLISYFICYLYMHTHSFLH